MPCLSLEVLSCLLLLFSAALQTNQELLASFTRSPNDDTKSLVIIALPQIPNYLHQIQLIVLWIN